MGYSRKSAIRKSSEISQVIRQGRCCQDNLLRIHFLRQEPRSLSRAALVVPRFGRTVVKRNLLKRRLQEIVRSCDTVSRGFRLVVRCLPGTYEADFYELKSHFDALAAGLKQTGGGR